MQNNRKIRNIGLLAAVALFLVMGAMLFYNTQPVTLYKYHEIVSYIEKDQVKDLQLN